jgi:hypothetical protein
MIKSNKNMIYVKGIGWVKKSDYIKNVIKEIKNIKNKIV